MTDSKPHFSKLTPKDLEDLFEMVVRYQSNIMIWSREEDIQETVRAENFSSSPACLTVSSSLPPSIIDKEVLLNFSLSNRIYFTSALLTKTDDDHQFVLKLSEKVFKCEQRRSFRLASTSKHHLEIFLDGIQYDATDVSVSGIAILINKKDSTQFIEQSGYDNVLLKINNHEFKIPFCKIIHKRPFSNDSKQIIVGIEFIEVTRPLEIELYRTINDLLFIQFKS